MTELNDDKPKTQKEKSFKEQILAELEEANRLRKQHEIELRQKEKEAEEFARRTAQLMAEYEAEDRREREEARIREEKRRLEENGFAPMIPSGDRVPDIIYLCGLDFQGRPKHEEDFYCHSQCGHHGCHIDLRCTLLQI